MGAFKHYVSAWWGGVGLANADEWVKRGKSFIKKR